MATKGDSRHDPTTKIVVSLDEVAYRLDVGRTTAKQLVTTGQIEAIKVGSLTKVLVSSLDAYVERARSQRRGVA